MKKTLPARAAVLAAVLASVGLLLAACSSAAPPAADRRIVGRASVIDGDTIEVRGRRLRLDAIDAPEARQSCGLPPQPWACGRRAAAALADVIGARTVICRWSRTDRYRRPIARCRAGRTDLSAWMVRAGWALAYRRYSKAYVAAEDEARAERRGIWTGPFTAPWDYRRG